MNLGFLWFASSFTLGHNALCTRKSITSTISPYRGNSGMSLTLFEAEYIDGVECNESEKSRRFVLNAVLVAGTAVFSSVLPEVANAENNNDKAVVDSSGASSYIQKPSVPLDALIPATRVRVLIDRVVDATNELAQTKKKQPGDARQDELVSTLNHLLLETPRFMTREASKPIPKTWGSWSSARQKEAQAQRQIEVDPLVRATELFEQWGERRQWNRLKRQEKVLERSNDMRAAFNAATSNIVFGESYTLNASKEEKSRLIRTYDQLPDVTSVIRSDLDLRDLLRNQVLTAFEDAQAEWSYQTNGDKTDPGDVAELLVLLKEAQTACLKWFDFLPEEDIQGALTAVLTEE